CARELLLPKENRFDVW
nr:immunoglobulin heavy chain junction region [Macaca mulatta]